MWCFNILLFIISNHVQTHRNIKLTGLWFWSTRVINQLSALVRTPTPSNNFSCSSSSSTSSSLFFCHFISGLRLVAWLRWITEVTGGGEQGVHYSAVGLDSLCQLTGLRRAACRTDQQPEPSTMKMRPRRSVLVQFCGLSTSVFLKAATNRMPVCLSLLSLVFVVLGWVQLIQWIPFISVNHVKVTSDILRLSLFDVVSASTWTESHLNLNISEVSY